MSKAYCNELDKYAAEWLRNLIAAGHIAPGDVDSRSIEDVRPGDLSGYTQCHFFAGVGVWSYALRRAGWPDSRSVWTGSCPCQPFSAAGKGDGFADERHLWPHWHYLIGQRRPIAIFGEQVASKDADAWVDLVQTDLEAVDYAFGAVPFPSAGVGAPHLRDRLYWVADDESQRRGEARATSGRPAQRLADGGSIGGMGNNNNTGLEGLGRGHQAESGRHGAVRPITEAGEFGGLGDASDKSRERGTRGILGAQAQEYGERFAVNGGLPVGFEHASESVGRPTSGPTNGHWRDADWLFCRDGKWRPVESGAFPLAHGASARVGRLRAYGNAINAEAAIAFIESYMECRP